MKPTLLIVGLGNPGATHERSRHNVGFQAIDTLSEVFGEGDWQDKQKFSALVQEGRVVTVPVLLVKPQTYMNLSGDCIRKLVDFYKLDPANQLLVICDCVDLDLGEVRMRDNGGPGTHNGLKSIVDTIGESFARLRIGLGEQPAGADLAAWVLSTPSPDEQAAYAKAFESLPERIKEFVMSK
jgi:PTH1 family peptidyl-tRNA hydrolase